MLHLTDETCDMLAQVEQLAKETITHPLKNSSHILRSACPRLSTSELLGQKQRIHFKKLGSLNRSARDQPIPLEDDAKNDRDVKSRTRQSWNGITLEHDVDSGNLSDLGAHLVLNHADTNDCQAQASPALAKRVRTPSSASLNNKLSKEIGFLMVQAEQQLRKNVT